MPSGDAADRPARRADPGRVAAVQAQARPTLVVVAAFLLAAPIAAAVPHDTGRWLPLHLVLAGALVLAVSGASQFLAVTWGAAPAPPGRWVAAQRWLVAAGAVAVAAGRESGTDGLTGLGAAATAGGLVVLAVLLVRIGRGAVQPRVRPAIVAYVVAAVAGVAGVALGGALGLGHGGGSYGRWRDAHQALNLLGLAGFTVAGTLPFFVATQAKVRTSRHATTGVQLAALVAMALGLAAALAGMLDDRSRVAAAGLALYGASLVVVVSLLPRLGAKQFRWAGPRLVQGLASLGWWVGSVALAAVHAARGTPPFGGAVVPALVVGGYAQLLVGSLSYLGPVLVGGGHERLAASFRLTRSWVGLVAANVAAAAACGLGPAWLYGLALGAWSVDGAVRAAALLRARSLVVRG
jgi:nitrite reductase (NO-forming)